MNTAEQIINYIESFRHGNGWHPRPVQIATALGISRQAVHYYFKGKLKDKLKEIPEYKQYFCNSV